MFHTTVFPLAFPFFFFLTSQPTPPYHPLLPPYPVSLSPIKQPFQIGTACCLGVRTSFIRLNQMQAMLGWHSVMMRKRGRKRGGGTEGGKDHFSAAPFHVICWFLVGDTFLLSPAMMCQIPHLRPAHLSRVMSSGVFNYFFPPYFCLRYCSL